MQQSSTRLTKADLAAIEARIEAELNALPTVPDVQARLYNEMAAIGQMPTIKTLEAEGLTEERAVNGLLDFIASVGRVLTLFAVEFLQAFAALLLAIGLIVLEADRINAGVTALGQHPEAAQLIAIIFTGLNFLLPIYRLRNLTGQTKLPRNHWTVRGYLTAFWRRLTGQPQAYSVDVYDNPALVITETAITWATLFLAFYSVLHPMLVKVADVVWYRAIGELLFNSDLASGLQLLAGLLLSIGGVFGVQSIGHELGVRRLTDKTARLADVLATRKADYLNQLHTARARAKADYETALAARAQNIEAIRQRMYDDYAAAKIADEERKRAAAAQPPTNHNGNHHGSEDFLALPPIGNSKTGFNPGN